MWGGQERFLLYLTDYSFIIVPPQLLGTQLFKLCRFSPSCQYKTYCLFCKLNHLVSVYGNTFLITRGFVPSLKA